MEVVGSYVFPLAFPHVDRVFRVTTRVERKLPCSVVLGAR